MESFLASTTLRASVSAAVGVAADSGAAGGGGGVSGGGGVVGCEDVVVAVGVFFDKRVIVVVLGRVVGSIGIVGGVVGGGSVGDTGIHLRSSGSYLLLLV
jgi:hypothetical protein